MNIVILLTCTVNTQPHISWLKQRDSNERLKMYLDVIIKWLTKTNLKIAVIENSGIDLKKELILKNLNFNIDQYLDRFESITYKYDSIPTQDKNFLDSHEAKGHHELYAINYAYNNSKLIKNCSYLVKITGRYFIPLLEKTLLQKLQQNNNSSNSNLIKIIRQSQKWRGWNRCEILGCHITNFNELFKYPSNNDMLEEEYTNRVNNKKKNNNQYQILELQLLQLDKPTKQGVGKTINTL
jgi:hypothetical protein